MPLNKLAARINRTAAPFIVIALGSFLFVAILIPAILVDRSPASHRDAARYPAQNQPGAGTKEADQQKAPIIPVYRTASALIEQVPLETYVRNVLAAEMPADFELEALKAQ